MRHKDGAWRIVEAVGGLITGSSGAVSLVINCREITQRKQAEETIRHLAYHDSLTGLPNRALLEDRLAIALARAKRSGQTLAVIFLDLDEFKLINDTLGHSIGDELLRGAAERLKVLVRDGDTVARVGGDEFVLLLTDVEGVDDVVEVAERVGRSLKEPYRVARLELTVTSSAGISFFPADGEDATALLRNADTAMYRAKDEGRDNFQLYTSGMGEQVRKRLTLENELRRAIDHDQLVLHYQPIVDIRSGEISTCEALVRWQHPERGLVPPIEFIGVAEKAGLITALSEWVMRSACLQHNAWQDAGLCPVPIAVNISSHRFQYTGFGEMTRRILSETSLDPRNLHLEITEGVLMEDVDRAAMVLKGLRDLGMHISIDDFGTGYSSLSYLRHLPIDVLKIDMSFVSGITSNREDQAIVRAIIALARSLRLKVIAEGVETREQLHFLRDEGCDLAQGFLFARPMPAPDFATLITTAKALVPATYLPLH
jgi:diguanylate cyclase (GGDEF)-like protein